MSAMRQDEPPPSPGTAGVPGTVQPAAAVAEPGNPVRPRRRRFLRPNAVTLVAWLFLLHFVLLLLSGTIFWPGGQLHLTEFRPTDRPGEDMQLQVVFVSLGMLALVVSVGLFRLKRWAWLLAMTMEGLNLASALLAYQVGRPEYLIMAVGVITVLALNQDEVRQAFLPPEAPRA
ncbi:MAG TPA: hypothetical protein VHN78_06650 [Chloroflexota bacterium]|nr:hypothetical protein [Chloroflexota bacterium]